MPFVPVANTALVEVRMRVVGQKVENTLWIEGPSALDASALSTIATTIKGWWVSDYGPQVSDLVTLSEVVATDQTTDTSGQVSVSGDGEIGGQIGGTVPTNSTFAVSFRTASRGRAFRGRNYIVGVPLEQLAETNVVQSSWAADIAAAYTDLITLVDDAGFTWVVVSRFNGVDPDTHDPIPRVAGVTTPVLNVVTTDLTLDSQRRRLPGRGQ